jgi:NADPH oxidase
VIERSTPRQRLEIELFLTGGLSQQDTKCVMYNTMSGKDGLTSLQSPTNYGRPNFNRIFGKIKKDIQRGLEGLNPEKHVEVSVFACGPAVMVSKIYSAAQAESDKTASFVLLKEHF